MLDEDGFRLNVGIVIINCRGQCFWGRRTGNSTAWQFPQGGVNPGESEQEAMYRELGEELGLSAKDVKILDRTHEWLAYVLPNHYQRSEHGSVCIGQKQKWFLLQLVSDDSQIKLDCCDPPEFDQWRWVEYWQPLTEIVEFKRQVYRQVLEQFAGKLGR